MARKRKRKSRKGRVTFTKGEANKCVANASSMNEFGRCIRAVLKAKRK